MLRRRHEGIPSRTYRPENRKAISHRNSAEFIEVPGSLMAAVELLIDWLNYKYFGVTIIGFTPGALCGAGFFFLGVQLAA